MYTNGSSKSIRSPHRGSAGMTLIELVVVITLISIMFFFSIPRFRSALVSNDTMRTTRWLVSKVQRLKMEAAREHRTFILQFDIDAQECITIPVDGAASLDATATADGGAPADAAAAPGALPVPEPQTFKPPDGVTILDVEVPAQPPISTGAADIFFYARGYSDKAMIHLQDDRGGQLSLLIEPFLTHVEILKGYIRFEER